jgi:hypothetical protein
MYFQCTQGVPGVHGANVVVVQLGPIAFCGRNGRNAFLGVHECLTTVPSAQNQGAGQTGVSKDTRSVTTTYVLGTMYGAPRKLVQQRHAQNEGPITSQRAHGGSGDAWLSASAKVLAWVVYIIMIFAPSRPTRQHCVLSSLFYNRLARKAASNLSHNSSNGSRPTAMRNRLGCTLYDMAKSSSW